MSSTWLLRLIFVCFWKEGVVGSLEVACLYFIMQGSFESAVIIRARAFYLCRLSQAAKGKKGKKGKKKK